MTVLRVCIWVVLVCGFGSQLSALDIAHFAEDGGSRITVAIDMDQVTLSQEGILVNIGGEQVRAEALIATADGGSFVVVPVMGSWCPYCKTYSYSSSLKRCTNPDCVAY